MSRRDFLSTLSAASVLPGCGGDGFPSIIPSTAGSVTEIFDRIKSPRGTSQQFLSTFGFGEEAYIAYIESFRAILLPALRLIPGDKLACIDVDRSWVRYNRPTHGQKGTPNFELFISPGEAQNELLIKFAEIEEVMGFYYDDEEGNRVGTDFPFEEAIQILEMPICEIMTHLKSIHATQKRNIGEKAEAGFKTGYSRYMNNTSLTSIPQVVLGIIDKEEGYKFPMSYLFSNMQIEKTTTK